MLKITLVRNMRHLSSCVVVTAPEDEATRAVAAAVPGVRVHVTDAHRRHGARFNKGLMIEEGFDVLGRAGWLAIWDADCLWPDAMPLGDLRPDTLYGAKRRILDEPSAWHPAFDWGSCPVRKDAGPIGFLQIFHASSPYLAGRHPWYDVSFAHAGGADARFMLFWPSGRRVLLPVELLHLGRVDFNWFGTSAEGRELMAAFVYRNGWARAMAAHDPTALGRVGGQLVERVEVPGYPPSDYELEFVKRARAHRLEAEGQGPA